METRICRVCGESKSIDSFSLRKSTNKYSTRCKACDKAYMQEYLVTYQRPPRKEKIKDGSLKQCSICKEWYPNNLRGWHATVCPKCKAEKVRKYRAENKDILLERARKAYYSSGKEERDAKRRATRHILYWKDHNKTLEKVKRQYWKNRDVNVEKSSIYYYAHAKELYEKSRKRIQDNPDKQRKYARDYFYRKSQDASFRIMSALRARLYDIAIKNNTIKLDHTINLIGCNKAFLIKHIESQFDEKMTWDNYGKDGWVIDHIIPCAAFDFNKKEEQARCFHWSNLRPLWFKDNASKGDRLPDGTRARDLKVVGV